MALGFCSSRSFWQSRMDKEREGTSHHARSKGATPKEVFQSGGDVGNLQCFFAPERHLKNGCGSGLQFEEDGSKLCGRQFQSRGVTLLTNFLSHSEYYLDASPP